MKSLGRPILFAALLGMLTIPGRPASAQRPDHLSRLTATVGSQVDKYLAGLTRKSEFSGTVVVTNHGRMLFSKGYGMADRADHVMNRPDTLYPIAGVSHSFAVLGVVQLLQRGRVRLGNSICTYIARCPAIWQHVTIQSLEDARVGLADVDWGSATSLNQALETCETSALGLGPGVQAHFGNCGTYMRAAIIQRVTGKPWATFLRDSIWGPAGMAHTARLTGTLKPPKRAAAYSGSAPGNDSGWANYYQAYSTPLDVERYDQALFGGKLVGSTWLKTMMTPQAAVGPLDPTDPKWMPSAKSLRYGYYWQIGSVFGHRIVFTADDSDSFRAINLHFSDDGVNVIVVSNDDTNQIGRIAQEVARLTLNG